MSYAPAIFIFYTACQSASNSSPPPNWSTPAAPQPLPQRQHQKPMLTTMACRSADAAANSGPPPTGAGQNCLRATAATAAAKAHADGSGRRQQRIAAHPHADGDGVSVGGGGEQQPTLMPTATACRSAAAANSSPPPLTTATSCRSAAASNSSPLPCRRRQRVGRQRQRTAAHPCADGVSVGGGGEQ